MNNFVDTVEDRFQNAILTAIDNIVAAKIELAIRSRNASSRRDATSVITNSECRERIGIKASFKNASENNNIPQVLNRNDETRNNIPDEVSELSVPETRFDRQTHTHHNSIPLSASTFVETMLDVLVNHVVIGKRGNWLLSFFWYKKVLITIKLRCRLLQKVTEVIKVIFRL